MSLEFRLKMLAIPVLILCITLLGIPLLSLRQDTGEQSVVLANQQQALSLTAQSISSALQDAPDLFYQKSEDAAFPSNHVEPAQIIKLVTPIRLNGDLTDWQPGIERSEIYGEDHLLASTQDYRPGSLSFRHLAGTQGNYLYAFFDVYDDTVIYRNKNSLRTDLADHLKIYIDKDGARKNYIVSTFEPGWVNGFHLPEEPDQIAAHERRIHGNWRRTDTGYRLEIRIQNDILGDQVFFAVADVDDQQTGVTETLIGTARIEEVKVEEEALVNVDVIDEILSSQEYSDVKFSLIDVNREILAETGTLVWASDSDRVETTSSESLPKEIPPQIIADVFEGQNKTVRYMGSEGAGEVIAAILPLYREDEVVAATITEKPVIYLPPATNQLFREAIAPLLVAFFLGVLGLYLYSLRFTIATRSP